MDRAWTWLERRERPLTVALATAYAAVGLLRAFLGPFGHDDGFYAYAMNAVYHGHVPYRDFMHTQSPLGLYAFGLVTWPFGFHLGAWRAASVLAGLGAMLLAMSVARRLAGARAALVAGAAFVALGAVDATLHAMTLTALLLALSFWLLTHPRLSPGARYALAGAALGLAAGVRLNVLVAAPLYLAYVALRERRAAPVAWGALGGAAALLVVYAPFIALDADAAFWDLVRYHTLDGRAPGQGLVSLLKYKVDGFSYYVTQFPFAVATLVVGSGLAWWATRQLGRAWLDRHLLLAYAGALTVLIVLANFSKVYIQPYYPEVAIPIVAILAGVLWVRLAELSPDALRAALALVVAALLAMTFLAQAPPQIYKPPPNLSPSAQCEAGDYVASITPPEAKLFTLWPQLAVQAHREVLPGLEMGRLGYYPAMDNATAERYHLVNQWKARELLATRAAPVVLLAGEEFTYTTFPTAELPADAQAAMLADAHALIEEKYRLDRTFGEGPNAIQVWVAR